jgi:ribonuclease BN (tRNA processing enzyme)
MKNLEDYKASWENAEVLVNVHFSAAGVGTTILLTSKFTGKMMLLDVGDGVLRDFLGTLENSEFVNEINLIAISHGHFDHVGGLYSLLGFMRMLGRTKPLNIIIPPKCKEVKEIVKGFKELHHDTLPFKIWYHEISPGSDFDTDFFKVKAYEVEHYSLEHTTEAEKEVLEPAHGYRVRIGGTTVSYTGDTRLCSGAEEIVKDADLALIEATRVSTPKSGRRVHLSVDEAKQLGKLAKDFVLIHQIPK